MRSISMATNKTPAHKRIKRAEIGRDDWKIKAMERREENEKLKQELQSKDRTLSALIDRNRELEDNLKTFNKRVLEQDKLIENLKKKPFKQG